MSTAQGVVTQQAYAQAQPQAFSNFVYDSTSGYYYDATTGLYYDANTGVGEGCFLHILVAMIFISEFPPVVRNETLDSKAGFPQIITFYMCLPSIEELGVKTA